MSFTLTSGAKAKPRSLDFGPELRLTEEFRPKSFDDVMGQGHIVQDLRDFAAAPRSHAMMFEGPTGVGKSSMGRVLAHELGVNPTSGLWVIESGEQDGKAMDQLVDDFRFVPFGGGWRLVIVEEADWMIRAPKVYQRWNSILDFLPSQTVIVFTTNHASKFETRFLDRVESFPFQADYGTLLQDAQLLVNRIWSSKVGPGSAPSVESLGCERDGQLSFRRVVGALEPLVRDALRGGPRTVVASPMPVARPIMTQAPVAPRTASAMPLWAVA